jgi:hypothetical protein
MIKSVTITNYLGESIKMELECPEKSGFLIQNIEGLGPGKATINSTELATSDGSLFNSARLNSRNIVFTLKLLDVPTVETVRQKTYKYFPIKKRVHILIETDNRLCGIYGQVESNEPTMFTNEEITQISIICPDPYFYSFGGTNVTIFSGIEPMFEFPFSNESTTENLIVLSQISTNHEQTVYYSGDSEVGIVIYIHSLGDVSNITIYNSVTRGTMKIDTAKLTALTGSGIIFGDDIIISTVKGQKYVQLLRSGEYTNILNCLDRDAEWFQLTKGDNIFAFTAESGSTNLQFRIENQTIFEGV